jgi:hypothetical protein
LAFGFWLLASGLWLLAFGFWLLASQDVKIFTSCEDRIIISYISNLKASG